MGFLKIPEPSEEERQLNEQLSEKLIEYKNKFNDSFTTEFLPMSKKEIIQNIDKCIKHNRKWDGYIIPEVDENDLI